MDLFAITAPVRTRRWLAYPLAILIVVFCVWVRLAIGVNRADYPFVTIFPAVALAALVGGLRPGLLALLLGIVLAKFFFITPLGSFLPMTASAWNGVAFYCVTAGIIVALINGMCVSHEAAVAARVALDAANLELEQRVALRTAELSAKVDALETAQAQLRQMQKMEAVGQLTGGIAHDFNNMLSIIIGSLDLLKRSPEIESLPRQTRWVTQALEGANRAAVLTSRLMAFSRQQPLEPGPIDANRLILGMADLLQRTLGETIKVETVLHAGLWRCFADPTQVESALLNLCVNARDAMPDGGRLTIETNNSDLDERYAASQVEVTPGQYVAICVSDTGSGMPADVIERAFDPFFTTKAVGKGTGLGLAQVFGFVKQSGGHVRIYSEVGEGTTVKLYLPRTSNVSKSSRLAPQAGAELAHGHPDIIILVVEDDAAVRATTLESVRALGYTALEADGPQTALKMLDNRDDIDLMLTDIVMPDVNGRQLADLARVNRPALRVIYTTGYTRNAIVHNGVLDAGVAFLPKPFTLEQLAAKLGDELA